MSCFHLEQNPSYASLNIFEKDGDHAPSWIVLSSVRTTRVSALVLVRVPQILHWKYSNFNFYYRWSETAQQCSLFHGFGGFDTLRKFCWHQKAHPCVNPRRLRSLRYTTWKSMYPFLLKVTRKRKGTQSHKWVTTSYISAIWGAIPFRLIFTKIGKVVRVDDIFIYSSFSFNTVILQMMTKSATFLLKPTSTGKQWLLVIFTKYNSYVFY